MSELNNFVKMSKYAGERFDLVQAGGGNSSVKLRDGSMFIKASGFSLSEVDAGIGYCIVDNKNILKMLVDNEPQINIDEACTSIIAANIIDQSVLSQNQYRPSIETFLHSIMHKYVLHTHPIIVNAITCTNNWESTLKELFKDDSAVFVEYKTPGIQLALELKKSIQKNGALPNIVFLQNHGLIVSSDDFNEVIDLTEYVISKIEKFLSADMISFKLVSEVSSVINDFSEELKIAYLSCDSYLNKLMLENTELFFTLPFCPDKMVYCGVNSVTADDVEDLKTNVCKYMQACYDVPNVIIYKHKLFFVAKNIKKAKEIEDVFKFHVLSLSFCNNESVKFLPQQEIEYIGNWDAEKYRQKI